MSIRLTTKQAVLKVMEDNGYSMYKLGKLLCTQSRSIKEYLKGARMRKPMAARFEALFDITITDVFDPTAEALKKMAKNDSKNLPGRAKY